jgi:hypothetical protein
MRARFVAIVLSFASWTATAAAIPYVPPPQPVYEAPIERALENVAQMQDIEPAQRERLLGRLNLLAYARDDANFTYLRDGDSLNLAGSVACTEAGPGTRSMPADQRPVFGADERCARYDFNLGPQDELPDAIPQAANARALARLEAARSHYARAIALDGADLRARLGHAYTLDRLGRMDEARRELRSIVKLGLPRVSETQSEWETHAVLTEAAEHLAHVAASSGDRARVARLRVRLEASRPMIYITPVLVPLTDAPFARLIDPNSDVEFDLAGTGDTRAQGWITPEAAWLVWDPEWRGQIRSGFDLIGQRSWAVFWNDGFEALRALDDNRDGELTGAELGGLALWRDENSNGVSDNGEVMPVNVHGIAGLATTGAAERPGLLTAPRGVRFEDGRTRPLYDWTPGLDARAPIS